MFLLKGNRNYIHSSDIILFLEKKFPNLKKLKINFKSPIFGQPIFKFSEENKFSDQNFIGEFYLDNKIYYFAFLDTNNKNLKNYPYNEDYLFKKFQNLPNNSVAFFEESNYDNIDIFISMCKYSSINQYKSKKWSVIKIYLNQAINNLQCKYKKITVNYSKSKLIKYSLICNENEIGEIYFYNLN